VLGYENRMVPERCLLSIVFGKSRRKPFPYKIFGVTSDRFKTLFLEVSHILISETEFCPES